MRFLPVYYKNMNSFIDFSEKSDHLFQIIILRSLSPFLYHRRKYSNLSPTGYPVSGKYKQTLR